MGAAGRVLRRQRACVALEVPVLAWALKGNETKVVVAACPGDWPDADDAMIGGRNYGGPEVLSFEVWGEHGPQSKRFLSNCYCV